MDFWCAEMFRKKKAVHKTATTDDKRLQSTLKRIGVNSIPSIEEVNIFKDDVVIQFSNPKGQCADFHRFISLMLTFVGVFDLPFLAFSASLHCGQYLGCQRLSSDEKYVFSLSS